ncbi:MAG: DNA-binding response regulator [Bacteroidota bacterium]
MDSINIKTILVVDDQKEVVRMIAAELKTKNPHYRVINASNGEMGVEVAKSQQPDVIIMDWDMPVMNGIEATRRLRNENATHQIPIVMATGQMTSPEDLRIALEAGATDYVRKPIDFVELAARINTALRLREQNQAIQDLLQSDLDLKSRKLSTTSMLIVEKNDLMQTFFHDLSELEDSIKDRKSDGLGELKELKRRISNHLEVDNSWETFKLHFDEVNPNFFEEIQKLAPDLSHKDLKLCAYVKLGMDNKQIARLLNITPASTRTSLTRLKKKLGLDLEEGLRQLLASL